MIREQTLHLVSNIHAFFGAGVTYPHLLPGL